MRDIHGNMGAARLVASRSGWFPNPTQPVAGEEWLQVPLPDRLCVLCRYKMRQLRLLSSLLCSASEKRKIMSSS